MTMSPLPYVTYCTNCADIFADAGKETMYIMDILSEDGVLKAHQAPDLTSRRRNRVELKKQLCRDYLNMKSTHENEEIQEYPLIISAEVRNKMDHHLILEDNVRNVIRLAQESGQYILKGEDDSRIAHQIQGKVTYWVEYRPDKGNYIVENVYYHRVMIMEAQM